LLLAELAQIALSTLLDIQRVEQCLAVADEIESPRPHEENDEPDEKKYRDNNPDERGE